MKIEKVDIQKIVPYINNAKKHPDSQINQIKASITEFGFNDPIAIDENNVIIEGHGRFMALQQLDYKEVPVIKLKHLTEVQKKQYIIAHNKINMNTGFDKEILRAEIDKITEENIDIDNLGFSTSELEKIMNDKKNKGEKPEVEFTEELLEKHNYVVLYFDNEIDWLNLKTLTGDLIKTVKDSSSKEGYEKKGVGRVINGVDFIEKLTGGI